MMIRKNELQNILKDKFGEKYILDQEKGPNDNIFYANNKQIVIKVSPYNLYSAKEKAVYNKLASHEYVIYLKEPPFEFSLDGTSFVCLIMPWFLPLGNLRPYNDYYLKATYASEYDELIRIHGRDAIVAYLGYCICRGLKEMYADGIKPHRDIKVPNVFVVTKDLNTLSGNKFLLGDFDVSHISNCTKTYKFKKEGSDTYVPLHEEDNRDWQYDQFELGMLLLQAFNNGISRPKPLSADNRFVKWEKGRSKVPFVGEKSCKELKKIIIRLCEIDPAKRYSDLDRLIKDFEKVWRSKDKKPTISDETKPYKPGDPYCPDNKPRRTNPAEPVKAKNNSGRNENPKPAKPVKENQFKANIDFDELFKHFLNKPANPVEENHFKVNIDFDELIKHFQDKPANPKYSADFRIENGELKKYTGSSCYVVVPDGVTSIGERAFSDYWRLKQIIVPDSVKSIGNEAFLNCVNLYNVILPKDIQLGSCVFKNCHKAWIERRGLNSA